ncbi:AmpG family muropeptide MFS transporter [Marinicella litoralis]|uniref:PAT family beta-lactamase induction signal transducer AmpG n=1 Tax=Marinicella litoralis TaxID=644220 RepID=A0A4R6XNB1_9GAMM|nr:MFS transporter [Marinicella litoralis]TDR19434.1 PAT family beta-lactamase induction signal transducer AmpG [Marinicella litoralis]
MSETIKHLFNPKFLHMTLFGFSAGIPYFLIFSSLSLWLDQVGVEKSAITYFSWAALGYSFKFLWSPLVDRLPIPVLTAKLGQRRSWLILIQLLIVFAICWMGFTDPAQGINALTQMAFAVTLLGFSAATQDILIDAWRIEASNEKDITMLSSVYIVGYRLGMITSGAGALLIADHFGTSMDNYKYSAWQYSYLIMATCMLVGLITTIKIKEPKKADSLVYQTRDYAAVLLIFIMAIIALILCYQYTDQFFLSLQKPLIAWFNNEPLAAFMTTSGQLFLAIALAAFIGTLVAKSPIVNRAMVKEVYWIPVADLFKRHRKHVWLLIGIICTYRISDIVMGVTANLFYQHMGFDLDEIAGIVKTFGLIMTISGGLVGGVLVVRYGIIKMMILGATLSALTNLLFMIMASTGKSLIFLTFMISADNLSQGLALAVFVGFLSMLVNRQFTAVQYAMFSSVMTLFPKIMGGYSGTMVEQMGFASFYLMTAIIGIPVVVMLIYAMKKQAFEFNQSS